MNKVLPLALLLFASTSVILNAQTDTTKKGYQPATVVHVDEHMMPANPIGGVIDIDNEVPQPQHYVYDVEVRLGCDVYVGRYESPVNHLPPVFSPNHNLSVRLDGDLMDVSTPDTNRPLSLWIVSTRRAGDAACAAND
jgi:hypothetical protein